MDVEQVIQISAQIQEHRKAAHELEEKLRAVLSFAPGNNAIPPNGKSSRISQTVSGKTHSELIAEFLNSNPTRDFTVPEIMQGISANNENSIRGALSRMVRSEQIQKGEKYGYRSVRGGSLFSDQGSA